MTGRENYIEVYSYYKKTKEELFREVSGDAFYSKDILDALIDKVNCKSLIVTDDPDSYEIVVKSTWFETISHSSSFKIKNERKKHGTCITGMD